MYHNTMQTSWYKDQMWEKDWHGNCVNSYWEETKQILYAKKMGLVSEVISGKYPVYNLNGCSVLDVGGGAYSILLKCINYSTAFVIDPCKYPKWTAYRYKEAKIGVITDSAENIGNSPIVDEAWTYNCLQHTKDPEKIIHNMRSVAKVIRVFEWVDTEITIGHPHILTEEKLNKWLGGEGKTVDLNESGCVGRAYYGIFKGGRYEE